MRDIAVQIFPGFELLDAAGPLTAFEEARREVSLPAYRLVALSSECAACSR
jgi:putative intracellular protease/amidase